MKCKCIVEYSADPGFYFPWLWEVTCPVGSMTGCASTRWGAIRQVKKQVRKYARTERIEWEIDTECC